MKILFIEDALDGHHVPYLKGLTDTNLYESTVITPEYNEVISAKQLVPNVTFPIRKLSDYWKWISFIISETKKENYDVVHFLDGDSIMRFLGAGFGLLRSKKILITYHGFYTGILRAISYRCMCKNRIAVVHTTTIMDKLRNLGLANIEQVTYPSFSVAHKENAHRHHPPILGALGATRKDKGLDILLQALKDVKQPYKLIIAGAPTGFTEKEIEEAKANLSGEVYYDLRFLTDGEYEAYLNQVDIIVIPYRRSFNGASGPLSEGAARGKMIIAPDHGSLGVIVKEHHLGRTFMSENAGDLAKNLNYALSTSFIYDEQAKQYQVQLTADGFRMRYLDIYKK